MITDNILYQDIQYGYVFRDKHGKFLHADYNIGDTIDGIDFEDSPRYYTTSQSERLSLIIKQQKLKCRKQKVQISHTVELVAPKKPAVDKNGERLKKA